jgi:predicted DNA-binding transcriptional regulator AlpA
MMHTAHAAPSRAPELMDANELARMVGCCTATLWRYRRDGVGPQWIRIGRTAVRYRRDDVLAWIDSGAVERPAPG